MIATRTAARRPLLLGLGVGVAAVLTLAGCGSSGSDQAGGTTTVTATATATTTSTTGGSPTGSTGTTDPGSSSSGGSSGEGGSTGSNGQCAESQLRATVDPRHIPGNGVENTAGKLTHGVLIDFQNTSSSSCVLSGYPGAASADSSGKQVKQATRTLRGSLGGLAAAQSAPEPVTLAPGAYAAAMVEGVDQREAGAAQAGCDATYPRILVTPPNTEIPVPFDQPWGVCYSFEVHPVVELASPPTG